MRPDLLPAEMMQRRVSSKERHGRPAPFLGPIFGRRGAKTKVNAILFPNRRSIQIDLEN